MKKTQKVRLNRNTGCQFTNRLGGRIPFQVDSLETGTFSPINNVINCYLITKLTQSVCSGATPIEMRSGCSKPAYREELRGDSCTFRQLHPSLRGGS